MSLQDSMKVIQSKQNPQVKQWKKLHTAKGRKQTQSYLIEGFHLVEEAIQAGCQLQTLMVTDPNFLEPSWQDRCPAIEISLEIAKEISQTEQNQGIFAVIKNNHDSVNLETLINQGSRFLILDNIQDPGNLGTMIRTADAANYSAVFMSPQTVDIYNDKVIRATQGSLWHLPCISYPLADLIPKLQAAAIKVYSSALDQTSLDYRQISRDQDLAYVIGNEGQGVSPEIQALSDGLVHIPMPGQAESLNAAVAASILMFYSLPETEL